MLSAVVAVLTPASILEPLEPRMSVNFVWGMIDIWVADEKNEERSSAITRVLVVFETTSDVFPAPAPASILT